MPPRLVHIVLDKPRSDFDKQSTEWLILWREIGEILEYFVGEFSSYLF